MESFYWKRWCFFFSNAYARSPLLQESTLTLRKIILIFFSQTGWETTLAPENSYGNNFSSNETNIEATYYIDIFSLFPKFITICKQILLVRRNGFAPPRNGKSPWGTNHSETFHKAFKTELDNQTYSQFVIPNAKERYI